MSKLRLYVLINAIKHYISVEKLELVFVYSYAQIVSLLYGNYLVMVVGMLGDEVQLDNSAICYFLIATTNLELYVVSSL